MIKIIADAVLNPLLSLPDWLAILIFAFVVVVITNLIYKFMLDQKKLLEMKTKMKELQSKYKETKDEKHILEFNEINSKYMKMMFKPMMITMLIIFLLFPWMRAHYGDIETSDSWIIVGGKNISFTIGDGGILINGKNITFGEEVLIDDKRFVIKKKDNKIIFSRVIIKSKIPLPFTGKDWGWIAYYIVISLPLSMVVRKMMNINV